jgi:hypothetical protein
MIDVAAAPTADERLVVEVVSPRTALSDAALDRSAQPETHAE